MNHLVAPRHAHRHVDHRDGSGHLDRVYEAALRIRARAAARPIVGRAFVQGTSSTDASAEQSGEEFVMRATSGEEGGSFGVDEVSSEERGGPFVETSPFTEFAFKPDESNPVDGTREPFPTT
jgi:hypothetical protein